MEAPINTYPNTQPNSVPPPAPPPQAPMPKRTLFILIGALVIVAAVVAVFLNPGIRAWFSSFFGVSLEERIVLVKGMTEEGAATFYEFNDGKFNTVTLPEGVSLYSERAGVRAGAVGGTDISLIRGKSITSLYSDGEQKEAIAVSPDGTHVAFSSLVPGQSGEGIARWYVKSADVNSKELSIVGQGYGAQFFTLDGKTYILYTSTEGIAVADLASGDVTVTPITVQGSEEYAVVVSDNGKYLAIRDALIGQYFVYSVTRIEEGKLKLSSLHGFPEGVTSVIFKNDKLYAVQTVDAAQQLLVYATPDATEAESTVALPPSSNTYTLLP